MPLTADTMFFRLISIVIRSMVSSRYGDGMTSSRVSAEAHTSLMSELKSMREMSKSTSDR